MENDLAYDEAFSILVSKPDIYVETTDEDSSIHTACAVIIAMIKQQQIMNQPDTVFLVLKNSHKIQVVQS